MSENIITELPDFMSKEDPNVGEYHLPLESSHNLGRKATSIVINEAPSEISDISVHHTSEKPVVVIQSADVPFNESEKIPGTIDDTSESDRVVRGIAFKGAPTNVINHPANTAKMDREMTALTGIPVNNSTDVHDL